MEAKRRRKKPKRIQPVKDFNALPDWLRVEEVQRVLRISRNSAYELIRSGVIPNRKFGRLVRVPKESLRAVTL